MSTLVGEIACVVLNWNGGDQILRCLKSLLESEGVELQIAVVDNGSTDGSDAAINQCFPSINVTKLQKNIGVAAAWNLALERLSNTTYELVLLLNSDTQVESLCLSHLVETVRLDSDIGIVSPRIFDGSKSGRVWFDAGIINAFGDPVHRNFGEWPGQEKKAFSEDFSTGCAMLVRREVFERVGLFDEDFFAYSEDVDFCLRTRRKGWKIYHNPNASVLHFPSSSVKRNKGKWFRDFYVTRNKMLLGRKHKRGLPWALFLGYFSFKGVFFPISYFLVTAQFARIGAVISGVADFVRGKSGERYA